MTLVRDVTLSTLHAALRGLEAQRRAHEQNLANVETPGYLARRVSFRDTLRQAARTGDPARADFDIQTSTAPTRVNGNNVNVAHEVTGLAGNALDYQLAITAMNAKYALIRAAIER